MRQRKMKSLKKQSAKLGDNISRGMFKSNTEVFKLTLN
jgi:hypothetical protein